MEGSKIINEKNAVTFIYLIFMVGLAGHLIPSVRPLMLTLTPYTLLITGSVVFGFALKYAGLKLLGWAIITYTLTFILEAVGVKTGLIFGEYDYGNVLGLKLFDVPLIIGFNWVMVILGAISIAASIDKNIYLIGLLAGTLAVLFDIALEPVAINLDYWQWESGRIPLQNYYAWFIIAFVFTIISGILKVKVSLVLLEHYFIIQLIFFIILSIFL